MGQQVAREIGMEGQGGKLRIMSGSHTGREKETPRAGGPGRHRPLQEVKGGTEELTWFPLVPGGPSFPG